MTCVALGALLIVSHLNYRRLDGSRSTYLMVKGSRFAWGVVVIVCACVRVCSTSSDGGSYVRSRSVRVGRRNLFVDVTCLLVGGRQAGMANTSFVRASWKKKSTAEVCSDVDVFPSCVPAFRQKRRWLPLGGR